MDESQNPCRMIADLVDHVQAWLRPRRTLSYETLEKKFTQCEEGVKVRKIQELLEEEARTNGQKSKDHAIEIAEALTSTLSGHEQALQAVSTVLHCLKSNDSNQAEKDWPTWKSDLQIASIRLESAPIVQSDVGVHLRDLLKLFVPSNLERSDEDKLHNMKLSAFITAMKQLQDYWEGPFSQETIAKYLRMQIIGTMCESCGFCPSLIDNDEENAIDTQIRRLHDLGFAEKVVAAVREHCPDIAGILSLDKVKFLKTAVPAESKPKGELSPRASKVWGDFQDAMAKGKFDKSPPTDKAVFEWLLVHVSRIEEMPKFDTWRRYLRQARKYHGCQKNTPRAGRPMGRSIDTEAAAKPIHSMEREHRMKRSITQDD